jgi:chitodextrinase
MGQRFRLRADFNVSGFSSEVQVILRALKKYGMILADNGSSWYISGAPDSRWNNDALVGELGRVLGSDFEAIDESSLMLSPDSGQAWQAGSDSQAPSIPGGLVATVASSGQINLSWNASTDNVGVDGYLIYKNGAQVATTAILTFQSTGLTPSTSYSYRVAAYDAAGNVSLQSTTVTKMTLPATSTTFKVRDRVQTTGQTSILSDALGSGAVIGTQPKGAAGTVTGGPVYWNNQWWWSINFVLGPNGWVAEANLQKSSRPVRSTPRRSPARLRYSGALLHNAMPADRLACQSQA